MKYLWLLLLCSCALPTPTSFRPRGVDVYGQTGQSSYRLPGEPSQHGSDWSMGMNVHFDITYKDEWEPDE